MTALSFTALDSPTAEKRLFSFMPGRKMTDGTYVDIVHPLNNETLQMIQDRVVAEYEKSAGELVKRRL
jgi:DNA-binding cell septation regulator SpoVG